MEESPTVAPLTGNNRPQRPKWQFSGRRGTPVHKREELANQKEPSLPPEVLKIVTELVREHSGEKTSETKSPTPATAHSSASLSFQTAKPVNTPPVSAAPTVVERRANERDKQNFSSPTATTPKLEPLVVPPVQQKDEADVKEEPSQEKSPKREKDSAQEKSSKRSLINRAKGIFSKKDATANAPIAQTKAASVDTEPVSVPEPVAVEENGNSAEPDVAVAQPNGVEPDIYATEPRVDTSESHPFEPAIVNIGARESAELLNWENPFSLPETEESPRAVISSSTLEQLTDLAKPDQQLFIEQRNRERFPSSKRYPSPLPPAIARLSEPLDSEKYKHRHPPQSPHTRAVQRRGDLNAVLFDLANTAEASKIR